MIDYEIAKNLKPGARVAWDGDEELGTIISIKDIHPDYIGFDIKWDNHSVLYHHNTTDNLKLIENSIIEENNEGKIYNPYSGKWSFL